MNTPKDMTPDYEREPQFTPGPWIWRDTEDGHEIRMGSAVENYSEYESQHVIGYDHNCETDDDEADEPSPEARQYMEAEANARLISAAPDLLEALTAVVDNADVPDAHCSCHISPPCSDCVEYSGIREVIEAAKSAIAKATS